jgi:hypothetical protein
MGEARVIPKFATEKEEADWWYNNREKHDEEFVQAVAEGRVQQGNLREHFAEHRRRAVVRLDPETATDAQELATRRGMEVPDVLRTLVREALQREKQPVG